ncbi:PH domain-containing protein [Pseudoxanthomonas mexicana]|uniref:PH domain-containing protein n=1 Tax=Pseudoxanthomonas mexicana TaxID=128785 RepID=UPI00398B0595
MFSISALNPKTISTLLLLGSAPLLLIAGLLYAFAHQGKGSLAPSIGTVGIAVLLAILALWQLSVVRIEVNADTLRVGGGFYRVSVPLSEVRRDAVMRRDPADPSQMLGLRTNGIGMPGLALGWFRAKSGGEKIFAAVTEGERVLVIPTTAGYSILVSPDDPDALLEALATAPQ